MLTCHPARAPLVTGVPRGRAHKPPPASEVASVLACDTPQPPRSCRRRGTDAQPMCVRAPLLRRVGRPSGTTALLRGSASGERGLREPNNPPETVADKAIVLRGGRAYQTPDDNNREKGGARLHHLCCGELRGLEGDFGRFRLDLIVGIAAANAI